MHFYDTDHFLTPNPPPENIGIKSGDFLILQIHDFSTNIHDKITPASGNKKTRPCERVSNLTSFPSTHSTNYYNHPKNLNPLSHRESSSIQCFASARALYHYICYHHQVASTDVAKYTP